MSEDLGHSCSDVSVCGSRLAVSAFDGSIIVMDLLATASNQFSLQIIAKAQGEPVR